MKKIFLFFIFLLLWAHTAGAQSIITVDVRDSGDALWTMEKRLPLTGETEIQDWEEFIKKQQDNNLYQEDTEDFIQSIRLFLLSAQEYSNRPMKAEKFDISYDTVKTPSNSFGIIRYSFEWENFSYLDSDKIFIGDAFSEGMVLSSDNVLIIKIPDGYEVESVSPVFDKRDGNRLIWDGTLFHDFKKGEPALVLLRTGQIPLLVMAALAGLVLGASALFFKRKRKPESDDTENTADLVENLNIVESDYEEMIERILVKSGGQVSQSGIIKQIGLSKSRVSTILAQMKESGKIIKIRKGKENLIRLASNR